MTRPPTPEPLDAIDERGRAAAAGVRSALADRPVPAFDADLVRIDVDASQPRRPRSRPVVGLLAAAAAVLVVVAAVVALAGPGDDDSAPTDGAPGGLRRYLLSDVPRGFSLSQIRDVGTADQRGEGGFGPMALYGASPTEPVVGVFTVPADPDGDELPALIAAADEIDGYARRAWDTGGVLGVGSVAAEVGDTYAVAIGPGVIDDLPGIVDGIVVEGDRATLPPSIWAEGWSHLGAAAASDGFPSITGLAAEPGGAAWSATYQRRFGADELELIVVSSATGDPRRIWASRLGAVDAEEVEVRGHPALLIRQVGAYGVAGLTVTWEERPGEIVQVIGLDTLGRAGLVALAEGVVVAQADELPALEAEAGRAGLEAEVESTDGTVVGQGTFPSGIAWALVEHPGSDAFELLTSAPPGEVSAGSGFGAGSAGPEGEGPPPELFEQTSTLVEGEARFAWGTIPAEVAAVEVRTGAAVVAEAEVVATGDSGTWVVQVPADGDGFDLVARSADGAELGTGELRFG